MLAWRGIIMLSLFSEPLRTYESFIAKKPEVHFDYDEIKHEAHLRAFTIAKMTNIDLLKYMHQSIAKAIKEGKEFKSWKAGITDELAKAGWLGKVNLTNPKTGIKSDIYIGSSRLRRIFETNIRTAFAKSKFDSQMQSDDEYLRYTCVLDARTRPSHKRYHGLILHKNDPFWKRNYPPNDWGCRCEAVLLSESYIKRKGLKVGTPPASNIASPDWAYSLDTSTQINKLDGLLEKKSKGLISKTLDAIKNSLKEFKQKRKMQVWQKGLDEAIDELIVKGNIKAPINVVQVGELSENLTTLINKMLNKPIQTSFILIDKKALLHIRPERKGAYNQALRVDEIRQIPRILASANDVRYDHEEDAILFLFDDSLDKNRVNKIAIRLDYTIKKFGVSNYVVTVGKVYKTDILGYQEITRQ